MIASVAHDLGHDGFTNGYHVNACTSRAINSNDGCVQEHYHASELFRILEKDKFNFLDTLSKDEFKIFRKRVVGLILSTDMAKHATELSNLKSIKNQYNIKGGLNVEKLTDIDDENTVFKNQ